MKVTMNYASLSRYIKLYTDIDIQVHGNQFKFLDYILDTNDKFSLVIIYGETLRYMFQHKLNTVQVYYLTDIITLYLKEIAKLRGIDPSGYKWTTEVFGVTPELSVLYNSVEGFKSYITGIANGTISSITNGSVNFPLEFILDGIDRTINAALKNGTGNKVTTDTVGIDDKSISLEESLSKIL